MCGFIAAFTRKPLSERAARAALERLRKRGPDDEGEWRAQGVYLGHRRLAIVDLNSRSTQPMHSESGRYVIVFNGEIYNFRELREELGRSGYTFRTTSDTEVLIALYEAHGPHMLSRLSGMFAFVIWDQVEKKAFAARDPYGIKPLFLAKTPDGILVASQVKALTATGLVDLSPDPIGQAGFWMLGSVPEPHTWFRDIQAVRAGHHLTIRAGQIEDVRSWSDICDAWRKAPRSPLDLEDIAASMHRALQRTVERHLVSDVPVGVFLSGGVDSGALAGLMVDANAKNLQGVTIAFSEFAGRHEDEVPVAATVAKHYGIQHHVRTVTKDEFLEDLPRLLDAMDQPSIDGVNTWYATKAAAEVGLKVVVSGVGGDELFFGYDSFRQLPRLVNTWSALARAPLLAPLARTAARLQAARTGVRRWQFAPDWATSISGAWWLRRSVYAPDEVLEIMGAAAPRMLANFRPDIAIKDMVGDVNGDLSLALGQIESATYLRNQLLRDSDWASMDHGVELRTPLVDARLLSDIQPHLSSFVKISPKKLLASAPSKHLPASVTSRKKSGFATPLQQWLLRTPSERGWRTWMDQVVLSYEESVAAP